MKPVHFHNPLQTILLGLLVEVTATPEVLEKLARPLDEDSAQAIAKLVDADLKKNYSAKNTSILVAAGLLDKESLEDEDLNILIALEHVSEQYIASHPRATGVALTMTNNGLDGICFPQLVPSNYDHVPSLSFCIPVSVVGGQGALDAFDEKFFPEDRQQLQPVDNRVIAALANAFGLQPEELRGIGYEDLDEAAEALSTYDTHTKVLAIQEAASSAAQVFHLLKTVPVFVSNRQVRVCFFTLDSFARRMPHLVEDDLEDMYLDFQRDFRFVMEILTSEGLSPVPISYPSASKGQVLWDEVAAAKKLDPIHLESGQPGLHEEALDRDAASLDLVCMKNPDDESLVAATLCKLNESGQILVQTNLYPLTIDAMSLVFEYAKAIAHREKLPMDITEGSTLFINNELRALSAPPYARSTETSVAPSRTLH